MSAINSHQARSRGEVDDRQKRQGMPLARIADGCGCTNDCRNPLVDILLDNGPCSSWEHCCHLTYRFGDMPLARPINEDRRLRRSPKGGLGIRIQDSCLLPRAGVTKQYRKSTQFPLPAGKGILLYLGGCLIVI